MRSILFLFAILIFSQISLSQNQWSLIYYENQELSFRNVHYENASEAWAVKGGGVIAYSGNGGSSWQIQYEKPEYSFSGVHFSNDQNGCVVGWSEVFKTSNGGENWVAQDLPNPLGLDNESVFFLNPDTGWIAGSYKTIYNTTDGGNTWEVLHPYELEEHYWLLDIKFYDELHGCAVGDKLFMPYKGIILTTNDGGETWTESIITDSEGFKTVEYISQDTLWAGSSDGKLFKSTDGGFSWSLFQGISGNLYDLHFFNSNDAIAIAGYHDISITHDGWESWESTDLGFENSIRKFSFSDNLNGIGVGNFNIIRTSDGGNNWNSVFDSFLRIAFFNADNGWLIPKNETNQMLHSIDGGQSWDFFNAENSGEIIDMDFISEQTGFALSDSSELLKTFDAGETWEIIIIPFDSMYFSNMHFIDEDNGIITTLNSKFLRTENGGDSWFSYTFDTIDFLRNCFFLDDSNIWVTGSQGLCAHSNDGGLNWDIQDVDSYYLTDVFFINPDDGFLISITGELYRTIDGGKNWEEIEMFDTHLTQLKFIDDLNGWIIGEFKIFHTEDGGITWTIEFDLGSSNIFKAITSFSAITPDSAWFCTRNGKIYSYDLQTRLPEETKIELQLFPNPTSHILNISTELISGSQIIEIYSLEGKFIMKKEINQWENPIQINVSNFKTGVYILKIKGQKGVYKWVKK